jgi:hypothetical protein
MYPTSVAKRLAAGNTEGSRKVGRARWRWMLDVKNNLQELKVKQQRQKAKTETTEHLL